MEETQEQAKERFEREAAIIDYRIRWEQAKIKYDLEYRTWLNERILWDYPKNTIGD